MVIAFIPARGGSKSIPLKNIKLFCGKPLVCWNIEALESCPLVDRIIVATDSKQIEEEPGCAAFGTSQKPDVRRLCRASGFFRVITDFCLASKPAECARRRKWQASACFSPLFAGGPLLRADSAQRPLGNPLGAAAPVVSRLCAALSGRNCASMPPNPFRRSKQDLSLLPDGAFRLPSAKRMKSPPIKSAVIRNAP